MKYSEISDSFAPSYPFKMGDPGQFLGNRVADETLQMNLQGGGYYLDSDLVQYMELDEFDNAISNFEKASAYKTNKEFTPIYLTKLAVAQS